MGSKRWCKSPNKRLSCAVHVHILVYRNIYLQVFYLKILRAFTLYTLKVNKKMSSWAAIITEFLTNTY